MHKEALADGTQITPLWSSSGGDPNPSSFPQQFRMLLATAHPIWHRPEWVIAIEQTRVSSKCFTTPLNSAMIPLVVELLI